MEVFWCQGSSYSDQELDNSIFLGNVRSGGWSYFGIELDK